MQKRSATTPLTCKRDYWPTPVQELLLRASLLQSNDAKKARNDWKFAVDFDRLDTESNLLLPLFYTNLLRLEVKDPLMSRLKGIYRYTWYKNQLLLKKLSNLLNSFHEAGIQTVILNGVAVTTLYSIHYGSRQIDEFSLMVYRNQASEAVNLLMKMGWRTNIKSPENLIPHIQSIRFKDSHGWPLDLNFEIGHECHTENSDYESWDAAISIDIHDIPAMALNPTDQLMHVCIHGEIWHEVPSVRRVADAMMVINTSHSEIHWNRLIDQTLKRGLILPLRDTLNYLNEKFEAPVPKSVLRCLNSLLVVEMET
jgi:hypothetical protein